MREVGGGEARVVRWKQKKGGDSEEVCRCEKRLERARMGGKGVGG